MIIDMDSRNTLIIDANHKGNKVIGNVWGCCGASFCPQEVTNNSAEVYPKEQHSTEKNAFPFWYPLLTVMVKTSNSSSF